MTIYRGIPQPQILDADRESWRVNGTVGAVLRRDAPPLPLRGEQPTAR
jgi:hypothetical protein